MSTTHADVAAFVRVRHHFSMTPVFPPRARLIGAFWRQRQRSFQMPLLLPLPPTPLPPCRPISRRSPFSLLVTVA
jgi:hypothetical protein